MANDRVNQGNNIGAELPEITGQVATTGPAPSLVQKLIPTVDKIRQLRTFFGMANYAVSLVHIKWSGTQIGEGVEQEISRTQILPNPVILDMTTTQEVMRSFGLTEEGTLVIDQISIKYSEDDLMGRTPDMISPTLPRTNQANTQFFWEVVELRKQNPSPIPRRYVPVAVPNLDKSGFAWKVALVKQTQDRSRNRQFSRTNQ